MTTKNGRKTAKDTTTKPEKLTRRRLAAWVAEQSGLSKNRSYEVVNDVLWGITKSLAEGSSVELRDFGVFRVVRRKSRKVVVPGKGQVHVPSRQDVRFYAGKVMKEWINEDEDDE